MHAIKEFLRTLGFGRRSDFLKTAMNDDNLRAIKLICALSLFSAFVFLHMSYTDQGYQTDNLYLWVNRISIPISLVSLICTFFYQRKKLKSYRVFYAVTLIFILWMTFYSIVVSLNDVKNHSGFMFFVTVQTWIYDVILIPPYITILLSGSSFAFFLWNASRILSFPPVKYAEFLIFFVTVAAINYSRYRNALGRLSRQEDAMKDNARLDRLSTTDGLTSVRNRAGLKVDSLHLFSDHLYVMMTDVDNFKKYNDLYGHKIGDQVLESIAFALGEAFGRQHVYRYGGDEFLVLYAASSEDGFKECLERTKWYYEKMKFEGIEKPTGSFGYVYGKCHSEATLNQMIQAADEQLYQAKNNGKGQIKGAAFIEEP